MRTINSIKNVYSKAFLWKVQVVLVCLLVQVNLVFANASEIRPPEETLLKAKSIMNLVRGDDLLPEINKLSESLTPSEKASLVRLLQQRIEKLKSQLERLNNTVHQDGKTIKMRTFLRISESLATLYAAYKLLLLTYNGVSLGVNFRVIRKFRLNNPEVNIPVKQTEMKAFDLKSNPSLSETQTQSLRDVISRVNENGMLASEVPGQIFSAVIFLGLALVSNEIIEIFDERMDADIELNSDTKDRIQVEISKMMTLSENISLQLQGILERAQ